jgi:hypothetical protein
MVLETVVEKRFRRFEIVFPGSCSDNKGIIDRSHIAHANSDRNPAQKMPKLERNPL